ncbi:MAG: methyltransferase domain-containing protein [Nitrospiraceae bacterium]|nr:methyltransferase domain-containing protein [Nitrospiraceae bacterium]
MKAFRSSAQFYDALSNRGARLEREGPLLLDVLGQAPGTRVVDVACGTGLHAEFLAQHAAIVTAIDISEEMVAYARQHRGGASVEFRTGDMKALDGGPWDMAVCLGNSLSLLPSLADLRETFKRLYNALAPDGRFLAQVLNYRAPSAQKPRHRVECKVVDGVEVTAVKSLVPQGDRTLLSLAFFDVESTPPSSLPETAVLLNITDAQLIEAGKAAGFKSASLYGGFDRSPYVPDESSDVVGVWAK